MEFFLTALVLALVFNAWLLLSEVAAELPQSEDLRAQGRIAFRVVWNLAMQVTNIVIIVGAVKMKRLRSHGLCTAACILAVIPCIGPCFILGIPFGIWGLIVLNDPKVRQAFRNR